MLLASRSLVHLLSDDELLVAVAHRHPDNIVEILEDLAGSSDLSVIALVCPPVDEFAPEPDSSTLLAAADQLDEEVDSDGDEYVSEPEPPKVARENPVARAWGGVSGQWRGCCRSLRDWQRGRWNAARRRDRPRGQCDAEWTSLARAVRGQGILARASDAFRAAQRAFDGNCPRVGVACRRGGAARADPGERRRYVVPVIAPRSGESRTRRSSSSWCKPARCGRSQDCGAQRRQSNGSNAVQKGGGADGADQEINPNHAVARRLGLDADDQMEAWVASRCCHR